MTRHAPPTDSDSHAASVAAWRRELSPDLTSEGIVGAFEEAFTALWARAQRTLGGVTLVAIARRVLHTSAVAHPELAALEVHAGGLRCDELRRRAEQLDPVELAAGVDRILVELLTIIGNLTAEVLTSALHGALADAATNSAFAAKGASRTIERERRDPKEGTS